MPAWYRFFYLWRPTKFVGVMLILTVTLREIRLHWPGAPRPGTSTVTMAA